ncbi:MAG: alpha-galactosidase [Lachnospiraceae bacterium]|nr:alpha-galactosidase [Lachnospiraceae bacterium]
MIQIIDNNFAIQTKNTTYAFRVHPTGYLEHLYYGSSITLKNASDFEALCEKQAMAPGNTIAYDEKNNVSLENIRLELSSYGKGDIREPYIDITFEDGSRTVDLVFEQAHVLTEKYMYESLPCSYDDGSFTKMPTQTLKVVLKDKAHDLKVELYYSNFLETDVITRQTVIVNGSENIVINRIMSNQVDFEDKGYVFTSFNGAWSREMNRNDTLLKGGKIVNSSYTGTSSNRANPFVMISTPKTDEDYGNCYGFNLIYSGNHYECMEISGYGKTRFVQGINPETFGYRLGAKEVFEAPEAVMTFSPDGFNGMSRNLHTFIREHIVRGTWKHQDRPILINSWEACYFDVSEKKVLNLAKKAKDVGVELFVLDDGWFGSRNDDTTSLGDWTANASKLPNGLAGLSHKIKSLGMDFGIWVEPEMVNEKSHLYKRHPEWVLKNPATPHSTGRNQMILDLGQDVVRDFLIDSMSEVFSSGDIAYVKWDMNRNFSDYFSQDENISSGEVAHKYVLGLYKVMKTLSEKFPEILFEGCSSGGNRFDLGILCYFPQIWASDNTDAICRARIQNGLSYGYPQSVIGAHVSASPNHQTLRRTPLNTRFNVASMGLLGYELNLCDLPAEELKAIKNEIALYKSLRATIQWGSFYRGRNLDDGNICEWTIVSPGQQNAVTILVQDEVTPNMPSRKVYIKGLDPRKRYVLKNIKQKQNLRDFGDLVNNISPVHVKQDSWVYNALDKLKKLDGETELITGYGDTFSEAGVFLKQGFAGVGFNEEVAYFQDHCSRMYITETAE